ncbi:MAG: hypothetical protein ABIR15_17720 [Chitinophagaceae bacterium]
MINLIVACLLGDQPLVKNHQLLESYKHGILYRFLQMRFCKTNNLSMINIKTAQLLFLLIALSFYSNAQDKYPVCTDLKNGIFYNYPKNAPDQYMDTREGDWVHETNLITGDTTLWQIKWTDDCVYTLKYISGNVKINAEVAVFLKKHVLAIEMLKLTNEYYTFKSYVDKVSTVPILSDTMWLNQKVVVSHSNLIRRIPNSAVLKKEHFSDTSKCALVYLYRPGKVTNGLANYPIYLDEDIICVAQNNSGYIFKIFKEGKFEFKSKLFKDESAAKIDLKFGNTYYVKSMIHWAISSRLYNFKLETAVVDPVKGQKEFEDVNLR